MLHVELRAFAKHAERREHTWPTKSMTGTCTTIVGHGVNGAHKNCEKHCHINTHSSKINTDTIHEECHTMMYK
jgi:hypothetical protein